MAEEKRLGTVSAIHAQSGQAFSGYEIHIGRTTGPDRARPFARVNGEDEGAMTPSGQIQGSYLHGMFSNDTFRAAWLAQFGVASNAQYDQSVDQTLDNLADHLEKYLDVAGILAAAR